MPNKLAQFMFERIGVPNFSKYLDLAAFRHKLISGNVANASTPGYNRRDIDFKAEFERMTGKSGNLAGMTTHRDHIPIGDHGLKPPEIHKAKIVEGDMNSVDIDREVATLAKNELMFSVGARLLQRKLDGLKNVITSK
jgi:flagellar basal-body rod protein FlgB